LWLAVAPDKHQGNLTRQAAGLFLRYKMPALSYKRITAIPRPPPDHMSRIRLPTLEVVQILAQDKSELDRGREEGEKEPRLCGRARLGVEDSFVVGGLFEHDCFWKRAGRRGVRAEGVRDVGGEDGGVPGAEEGGAEEEALCLLPGRPNSPPRKRRAQEQLIARYLRGASRGDHEGFHEYHRIYEDERFK